MDRDQTQTKPKSGELPGTSKDPTDRVTSDKSSQAKSSQDKNRPDQGSSRSGSNYQNPQSGQQKRS